MKLAGGLLLIASVLAVAQTRNTPETPSWRSSLSALPATPPANTNAQDIVQFEKNMRMAAPYLGNTTPTANPAQWEANRAMVRRMAAYLYGLQMLSGNRQLRGPITRAQHSFDALGFAPYLAYVNSADAPYQNGPYQDAPYQDAPQGPPSQQPEMRQILAPPFAMNAPESSGVSDTDKETAADLHTRYDTDAAHSAGVWQNAETLRQNLEMRGLGLNLETATSMVRLPQHFNSAANSLRRNDWDGARTHLQQAEAETEKIARTVGR